MSLTDEEKRKRLEELQKLLAEEKDSKDQANEKEEDNEGNDEENENEDNEDKENMKKEEYEEHLIAMFDGADLSEEIKNKIKILFEAAVNYEVDKKVATIKANLEEELQKAIEAKEKELTEEADAYLTYVVEEWTSKNEVALKQQIKLDIMESFIGGLRQLFLEHNFNVPEEQFSMVDELMEKVESLQGDIKALSSKNVKLSEELDATKRELKFKEISEGMSELDIEKLRSLVEAKHFETAEEFANGVALIKESYFKKEVPVSEQQDEIVSEQQDEIPSNIKSYVELISKSIKNNQK